MSVTRLPAGHSHNKPISRSTIQYVSLSLNQPIYQSLPQPQMSVTRLPAGQSHNKPISRSTIQSVSLSLNQPILSITCSTTDVSHSPTSRPVSQQANWSLNQPICQSLAQSVNHLLNHGWQSLAHQPASLTINQSVAQPASQSMQFQLGPLQSVTHVRFKKRPSLKSDIVREE
jgi:hypothetical protein